MITDHQTRTRDVAVSLQSSTITIQSADVGERNILDNFSLECEKGEFICLVGRSGCGKTTVLNAVSGLLPVTSGSIEVLGTTPKIARPNMGYMFARDALQPWRTAQRNAELTLEIQGVDKDVRREAATKILDELGLGAAKNSYPWQLSHGMRQRVALARTWAAQPDLVLMDEPFAALDYQTRMKARTQFINFWEAHRTTVLFVTHDLAEALFLGDRVIVMSDGQIKEEVVVPFDRPRERSELSVSREFRTLEQKLTDLIY